MASEGGIESATVEGSATTDGTLSDEQMRKLLKPKVPEDRIIQIIKDHYASEGQRVTLIKEMDSYDDQNFYVRIGDKHYLFKVHNGVESNDYSNAVQMANGDHYKKGNMTSCIHLQNAMIDALTRHNITTTASVQPHNSNGSTSPTPLIVQPLPVVAETHSPCLLVCRLLTWVSGRPMASVKLMPLEVLADAGRFLGRVHQALDASQQGNSDWDASLLVPARRYHQWDGKNTADLRSYLSYIPNKKRRGLIASILDAFQTHILDAQVSFRKGLNHGDFNDANIILGDDLHVLGVIDFGDSVERLVLYCCCLSTAETS